MLNGNKVPFDQELYTKIAIDNFARSTINPYPNHSLAMKSSYKEHKEAPEKIKLPTLIIHGDDDPVYLEETMLMP